MAKDIDASVAGLYLEVTVFRRRPAIDDQEHCEPAVAQFEGMRLRVAVWAWFAFYFQMHNLQLTEANQMFQDGKGMHDTQASLSFLHKFYPLR